MAIKLRTDQQVELTYAEADENFSSLFYSASISDSILSLYYTGSQFAPSTNPVNIPLPEGSKWTASLDGSISRGSNVGVTGNVSIGGSLSVTGPITGSSFTRIGGTSGQILVANGTILTAGTNITISGGTISATDTDTTYTAGDGLALTGTTFSAVPSTKHYKKMVPYTVVEYYGSLTAFDGSGAGTGDWEQIYLCNGKNGTPDKRGVVGVGVTDGTMKGDPMPSLTNPTTAGNPTYTLKGTQGSNIVTLTTAQMPSHNHAGSSASSTTSDHFHYMSSLGGSAALTTSNFVSQGFSTGGNLGYSLVGTNTPATLGKTSNASATTTTTVTLAAQGGGEAHNNVQPGLGCYYIMYIPA
jgi:microcystin-dependent protein